MTKTTRIGLMIPMDFAYCRHILRGIRRYALRAKSWVFRYNIAAPETVSAFAAWPADGVIAYVPRQDLADQLSSMGKPVVNVSAVLAETTFPRVMPDGEAIGQLAAEDLLRRGFRNFAYTGYIGLAYSAHRQEGFVSKVRAAGHECHLHDEPGTSIIELPTQTWRDTADGLKRFIDSLPRPVGIMGCNDRSAWSVLEVCRELRLRVPEDVAVIGVDNDELVCELARPPLSSVAFPAERIGYEAAAILDKTLRGVPAPAEPRLIPPVGVVTRQSSDILAIDDEHVSAAVRFIREHISRVINVADVLAAVPVARRSLERNFRLLVGRSPLQEIRRVRMDRAKQLLSQTHLAMPEVAAQAGFSNARWLSTVFQAELGMSPTAYRRSFRMRDFVGEFAEEDSAAAQAQPESAAARQPQAVAESV
jgi:LacI family transcriptional regulator